MPVWPQPRTPGQVYSYNSNHLQLAAAVAVTSSKLSIQQVRASSTHGGRARFPREWWPLWCSSVMFSENFLVLWGQVCDHAWPSSKLRWSSGGAAFVRPKRTSKNKATAYLVTLEFWRLPRWLWLTMLKHSGFLAILFLVSKRCVLEIVSGSAFNFSFSGGMCCS